MIKYQTKEIVLPIGTTATTTNDTSVELDKAFPVCTGIVVNEKTDGGVSGYDVAVSDDVKGTYHSLTDKRDWIAGANVPLNDRYKKIIIKNEGQTVRVSIKPDATLVSELKIQVVFRLEKTE